MDWVLGVTARQIYDGKGDGQRLTHDQNHGVYVGRQTRSTAAIKDDRFRCRERPLIPSSGIYRLTR